MNGKTKDTNSHQLAKFCFEHGIELKRIQVVADDEEEMCVVFSSIWSFLLVLRLYYEVNTDKESLLVTVISIEASRLLVSKFDFVVTSGGIGPTHDGMCQTRLFRRPGFLSLPKKKEAD